MNDIMLFVCGCVTGFVFAGTWLIGGDWRIYRTLQRQNEAAKHIYRSCVKPMSSHTAHAMFKALIRTPRHD